MSQLGMLGVAAPRAVFSECGLYRYALWREWRKDARLRCLFVMLNPSTADSEQDDPTIRRCIGYAKLWGYDALDVANLYAFRSTDPKALWTVDDPVGPRNDEHIRDLAAGADRIVVAWGNNAKRERELDVLNLLHDYEVLALGITGEGAPAHPLYQRADVEPRPYWRGA